MKARKARDAQFLLAMLASVVVVGCITLIVWKVKDWVPVAVIVGIAAAMFTLIAYQLRKGKG